MHSWHGRTYIHSQMYVQSFYCGNALIRFPGSKYRSLSCGKCFGCWHWVCLLGWISVLYLSLIISPILSFSPLESPVFLISWLPLCPNKWKNACAYFCNLWQGEVSCRACLCDWQGSMLERRSEVLCLPQILTVCSQGLVSDIGLESQRIRITQDAFTKCIFLAHSTFFSHFHFSIFVSAVYLPASLFSYGLFFSYLCLSFSLCSCHTSLWPWIRFLVAESILKRQPLRADSAMSWWRHDVSHPVSQKDPRII